jgi:hypothetical protein
MDGSGDAYLSGVHWSLWGEPAHSPRIAYCARADSTSGHFAHAWLSTKSVSVKSANLPELWLATAALLLLGVQVLLGTALIRPSESSGSLKRVHLALGLGILALASGHVLLIGK